MNQGSGTGNAQTGRGVEIVEHGGYPELHVDGAPFFIHSAAFFYYRIPRDLWQPMLERYRSIGINTLDIYIPWNWHEPKEGEIDFDGHTNRRRDLRALLALIAQKHFRLIARPGPEILNEWRHGGYPGWLLERPEYNMNSVDWAEGRYPPLDNLNVRDAEAAARGWLDNATHMAEARKWLEAVARELAPYSSHRTVRPPSDDSGGRPSEASGPLLFVQLGDDFAIGRTNRIGPDFWRYAEALREMLVAGGLDVPVFINPTDMRASAAGSSLEKPIGVMGQWYMSPNASSEPATRTFRARDADEIEFLTEELKTQPDFPPVMIEYQAGSYAPSDDDRPLDSPPRNTVLSSRLLIANGIHGLNYFPLQDTFTPAGYSVPWANRSYSWNAALGPGGDPRPRLEPVLRNSQLLERWGRQLAASHKRADFGIVYSLGAFPQELLGAPDILSVSESVMCIERLGALGVLSSELLDPEYQPVEQLLRDALLLLPVFDPSKPQFQFSERAQRTLVEYVRRGGTLVVFPAKPAGRILEELWKAAPSSAVIVPGSAIRARWKVGDGEVIESSKDFFSWIDLEQGLAENRAQRETDWAIGVLREFVTAAGARPSVKISDNLPGAKGLIITEIVTNEGTGLLGERQSGQGFLSVTNLVEGDPAETTLEILSPAAPARGKGTSYISLHIIVPPRESLLLPLDVPICFADVLNGPCGDAVAAAGAEFLDAEREGKTLALMFYVPARADVQLRLAEKPSHVTLEETKTEANWSVAEKELQMTIPRGAAPDFLRVLRIDLPYTPHVPEREKPNKPSPKDLEFSVENAVRLPTNEKEFLQTYPPLVVPDTDRNMSVFLSAEIRKPTVANGVQFPASENTVLRVNPTPVFQVPGLNRRVVLGGEIRYTAPSLQADLSFERPLHGPKTLGIPLRGPASEMIEFRFSELEAAGIPIPDDHLFHSKIEIRSGHDRRTLPIVFLLHNKEDVDHYHFDFDRDGADEWVLENDKLRVIVSPESGGRVIALMDKSSGENLSSSVGLLRDNFSYTENPPGIVELRARGRYGLFDRSYAAEWQSEKSNPTLRLRYEAPDIFPAGASIEKTVQFEEANSLRVNYHVALHALSSNAGSPSNLPLQSFVAANSFPASAQSDRLTRFCWEEQKAARQPADATASKNGRGVGQHCEDFTPSGKPVEVPAGIRSVEVHTPGRPATMIGWDCVEPCPRMTIEPKNFSALFQLEFPLLAPGADAQYVVRIRALGLP